MVFKFIDDPIIRFSYSLQPLVIQSSTPFFLPTQYMFVVKYFEVSNLKFIRLVKDIFDLTWNVEAVLTNNKMKQYLVRI